MRLGEVKEPVQDYTANKWPSQNLTPSPRTALSGTAGLTRAPSQPLPLLALSLGHLFLLGMIFHMCGFMISLPLTISYRASRDFARCSVLNPFLVMKDCWLHQCMATFPHPVGVALALGLRHRHRASAVLAVAYSAVEKAKVKLCRRLVGSSSA